MDNSSIKEWLFSSMNFEEEVALYKKRLDLYAGHKDSLLKTAEVGIDFCLSKIELVVAKVHENMARLCEKRLEVEDAIVSIKCPKTRMVMARRYLHGEPLQRLYGNPYSKSHVMRLLGEGEKEIARYIGAKRAGMDCGLIMIDSNETRWGQARQNETIWD